MSRDRTSFADWIARPQSLIALAAVLLSVCGLFIAIYEASLVRRQQRASVWPYVEVSGTVTGERIELRVRNTGVGPARVRAAAVLRDGETQEDWADLIRGASTVPVEADFYFSLIRGRVLPRDSEPEVIFRLKRNNASAAPTLVPQLGREILDGRIEVALCYCSVYDECWTSSLQDVFQRSRGIEPGDTDRAVDGCARAPQSGI